MSRTLQRLQGLLGRVQENRRVPHETGSPAARTSTGGGAGFDPEFIAEEELPGTAPGSIPIELDASDPQPAPVHVPRAAAVPFEARASRAHSEPLIEYSPLDEPQTRYSAPASEPAPFEVPFEVPFGQNQSEYPNVEGAVITAPPIAQPSRPIAMVVSRHPSSEPVTFGKLLLRSLSLRAR